MIQSGDGDWIKNIVPAEKELSHFHSHSIRKGHCPERTEGFLFGGISPPNKKTASLCPLWLCGEMIFSSDLGVAVLKSICAGGTFI